MANPYTATNTMVSPEAVNTFLTAILPNDRAKPTRFTSTFVSSGAFGMVFHIDVDIDIPNPFETFYVTDEQGFIITSNNKDIPDTSPRIHRFCCKIVFITTEEDEFSFTNECVKQKDIYARTNQNLNSVCLPLFFYSFVSPENNTDPLNLFITEIFAIHKDENTQHRRRGISFMPYSINNLAKSGVLTVHQILHSKSLLLNSISSVTGFGQTDESRVIHIFNNNINIYSFCVVLSLLIRLYFAGYCHGDLHLANMISYPYPSGMCETTDDHDDMHETTDDHVDMRVTTRMFFRPMILLIDTGFAFRHSFDIRGLKLNSYEDFKLVINNIMVTPTPRTDRTMINYEPFSWFSQIFMDGIGGDVPTLNEDRCKLMFHLFQWFELYRTNFETYQLRNLKIRVKPKDLTKLNLKTGQVMALVDAYIASIPATTPEAKFIAFNSHGGRRRNYSVSNRKQTKINKKHTRSVRRRKSQKRRRRQRSKSKRY
jgi:hypothetical protein